MIQRGEKKKASDKEEDEDAEPDPKFKSDVGEIDLGKKLLQINKLKYVKEKFNELPETLRTKRFLSKKERRSDQRVLWKKELKDYEKGLQSKVKKKGEDERAKVEEMVTHFISSNRRNQTLKAEAFLSSVPWKTLSIR
jgi:hypothetical protein